MTMGDRGRRGYQGDDRRILIPDDVVSDGPEESVVANAAHRLHLDGVVIAIRHQSWIRDTIVDDYAPLVIEVRICVEDGLQWAVFLVNRRGWRHCKHTIGSYSTRCGQLWRESLCRREQIQLKYIVSTTQ